MKEFEIVDYLESEGFKERGNSFPDEIKANDIVYIQSEIGGRGNKLPSGENLGVYIPKDFDKCLQVGSIKLTREQAKKLAV
jgi:hypothetical protein|tara:strand:- start:205 stop:447 length:243 start_codon:yes stop_codon:yes gene_type:complete